MAKEVPKEQQYFSVGEISDQLGVSRGVIRRWIHAGELPALNVGGRAGFRVTREDLERFLTKKRMSDSLATAMAASR